MKKLRGKGAAGEVMRQKKEKEIFVFVEETCEYSSMFDMFFLEAAEEYPFQTVYETGLTKRWQQFLTSIKGQQLTKGKLSFLLEEEYGWKKTVSLLSGQYEKVFVIFLNASLHFHRPPYALYLKLKQLYPNIYYVLFYIDLMSRNIAKYSNYLCSKGVFDLIYTFDHNEASKCNYIFYNTPYSRLPDLPRSEEITCDLYFCASIKDRQDAILAILESSCCCRIKTRMDLVLYESLDSFKEYEEIVAVSRGKNLPYNEVLKRTLQSNCILEICIPGQSGVSLRAYEAVVYNKKLLTNNRNITTFPFYNSKYMHFYSTVEDIDWDWVRKKEPVDYGYNGEFSPRHLLDDIRQRIEAKC